MIVDCAYYEHGVRQERQLTIEEAAAKPRQGGNYVWIELDDPMGSWAGDCIMGVVWVPDLAPGGVSGQVGDECDRQR